MDARLWCCYETRHMNTELTKTGLFVANQDFLWCRNFATSNPYAVQPFIIPDLKAGKQSGIFLASCSPEEHENGFGHEFWPQNVKNQ